MVRISRYIACAACMTEDGTSHLHQGVVSQLKLVCHAEERRPLSVHIPVTARGRVSAGA